MEVGQRKSAIVLSQSAVVGRLVWFGMNLPPHQGLVVVNEFFDG